nr:hypothetical protein [Tanacetum cinerariifolium]
MENVDVGTVALGRSSATRESSFEDDSEISAVKSRMQNDDSETADVSSDLRSHLRWDHVGVYFGNLTEVVDEVTILVGLSAHINFSVHADKLASSLALGLLYRHPVWRFCLSFHMSDYLFGDISATIIDAAQSSPKGKEREANNTPVAAVSITDTTSTIKMIVEQTGRFKSFHELSVASEVFSGLVLCGSDMYTKVDGPAKSSI